MPNNVDGTTPNNVESDSDNVSLCKLSGVKLCMLFGVRTDAQPVIAKTFARTKSNTISQRSKAWNRQGGLVPDSHFTPPNLPESRVSVAILVVGRDCRNGSPPEALQTAGLTLELTSGLPGASFHQECTACQRQDERGWLGRLGLGGDGECAVVYVVATGVPADY
jgi:hypothetical protein